MDKELIQPNLHVALVHFPLALLIAGTLIELFSFMWRRHGFRAAGRWMILLGALSSIPTAMSGIYALADVANPNYVAQTWKATSAQGTLSAAQWDVLGDHVWLAGVAAGLAALVVVTWLGCSDHWRLRLHWPLLAVLVVSAGLLVSGAWHGGEAVYVQGIAVEKSAMTVTATSTRPATAASESGGESEDELDLPTDPKFYFPPLQMHVILAGCLVAVSLAALGLSIRKISQGPPTTQVDYIAAALGPPATLLGGDSPDSLVPEPSADHLEDVATPRVPASRFWMLAVLLGLLAAAAGYWTIADDMQVWSLGDLWNGPIHEHIRLMAHTIVGGSIVVVSLIMAMLARWGPGNRWLLALFALIILVAIVAQVWLGILLMFDTAQGPLMGFN